MLISFLLQVGHGLHLLDGVFRSYAQSSKVGQLVKQLGWEAAVLPQSMYIFKPPEIGGDVTPHQDSTFLWTEPRQTCLGLWLALEDADESNSCLWARPGSHLEPVRRQFARNPAYFEGNYSAPMMVFKSTSTEGQSDEVPVEGAEVSAEATTGEETNKEKGTEAEMDGSSATDSNALVSSARAQLIAAGFVPRPVRAGDLVVLHGALDHASLPNLSNRSRHTFQLHVVEGPAAGITWSPSNWLQYSDPSTPFPGLHMAADPLMQSEL
jgi:phytanoyl-CoA hydroxylase